MPNTSSSVLSVSHSVGANTLPEPDAGGATGVDINAATQPYNLAVPWSTTPSFGALSCACAPVNPRRVFQQGNSGTELTCANNKKLIMWQHCVAGFDMALTGGLG